MALSPSNNPTSNSRNPLKTQNSPNRKIQSLMNKNRQKMMPLLLVLANLSLTQYSQKTIETGR
jgi:hypothetical protein